MNTCSSCGANCSEAARFCPECGDSVDDTPAAKTDTIARGSERRHGNFLIASGATFALIALAVFAWSFLLPAAPGDVGKPMSEQPSSEAAATESATIVTEPELNPLNSYVDVELIFVQYGWGSWAGKVQVAPNPDSGLHMGQANISSWTVRNEYDGTARRDDLVLVRFWGTAGITERHAYEGAYSDAALISDLTVERRVERKATAEAESTYRPADAVMVDVPSLLAMNGSDVDSLLIARPYHYKGESGFYEATNTQTQPYWIDLSGIDGPLLASGESPSKLFACIATDATPAGSDRYELFRSLGFSEQASADFADLPVMMTGPPDASGAYRSTGPDHVGDYDYKGQVYNLWIDHDDDLSRRIDAYSSADVNASPEIQIRLTLAADEVMSEGSLAD